MAKERIEKLEEKIKELEARKQKMQALEKEKERKARAKKLIEIGAIFEGYFEIESKEDALRIAKNARNHVKGTKEHWKAIKHTEEEIKSHKLDPEK